MKACIACGMVMEKPDDFAVADTNKDYCQYCAREDGAMKSYEETLTATIPWVMSEYKISEEQAREQVSQYLKTMPAWKDK